MLAKRPRMASLLRAFSTAPSSSSSVSAAEVAHFSRLASEWWNPTGEFGLLHRMNPARVQFLRDSLLNLRELDLDRANWLAGTDVLDVGCGGGIFAETLARLGATILAVDAAPANIAVAALHASHDPALSKPKAALEYRHCTAEDLVAEDKQFDVVCGMEVVEHVENPREFLENLGRLTRPGGLLLLSTISRTPLAHLITLTLAESILGLVSPSTHTYSKYIKPTELAAFFSEPARATVWEPMEIRGCLYDPLLGGWRLLEPGAAWGAGELVNYFAGVRKRP